MDRNEGRLHSREQLLRVQMTDLERRKPNQLSGGQQQRVALARALAAGSDCLLLDEPLSNLDARLRLFMRGELRRLVKSSGITAMYVTHDQKEALSMADRIGVMKDGRIVQVGTPEGLYNRPSTRFVADFLGEANFIKGRLVYRDVPAKIETLVGNILSDDVRGISVGTEVTCCVRPERINVITGKEPLPGEGNTLLKAKVISDTYLGDVRQYICSLGKEGDTLWKISVLADSERLKESDWINLLIRARDVTLLTD
jgi:iron(III) transport system ATP-binding protein